MKIKLEPVTKWEYFSTNVTPNDRILNEMGKDGWELIGGFNGTWYFKRKL